MGSSTCSGPRVPIEAVENISISPSTSGCLCKGAPRAEELVSPAPEEKRLTACETGKTGLLRYADMVHVCMALPFFEPNTAQQAADAQSLSLRVLVWIGVNSSIVQGMIDLKTEMVIVKITCPKCGSGGVCEITPLRCCGFKQAHLRIVSKSIPHRTCISHIATGHTRCIAQGSYYLHHSRIHTGPSNPEGSAR
eukprot:150813-Amphidinium_carterae.1